MATTFILYLFGFADCSCAVWLLLSSYVYAYIRIDKCTREDMILLGQIVGWYAMLLVSTDQSLARSLAQEKGGSFVLGFSLSDMLKSSNPQIPRLPHQSIHTSSSVNCAYILVAK